MSMDQWIATIIVGLASMAFFLIKIWWRKTQINTEKIASHDVQIATINANMEHIRVTGDDTRTDVKQLLRRSNGNRSQQG